MSDAIPDLSSDLGFDREAIEVARRSAFAVATHRPEDFEGMRKAGRIAAEVLDLLVPEVRPDVTTAALDRLAFEYTVDHGALPACLGYRGYRHTLCTSINHVVCHGIPADRPLKDGEFTTACAQACPSDAIVFGNVRDPGSRVARLHQDPRGYRVLEDLNTRSAITYLAKVVIPLET